MVSMKMFLLVILSAVALQITAGQLVGGLGELKAATPELQKLVNYVQEDAEDQLSKRFKDFKAIAYRSQVVAGTIYYVKVKVGHQDYIHVKILTPPLMGRMPKLLSLQANKSRTDRIAFF